MELLRAEALAREALETHGLLAAGWSFRWDSAKRRFGVCRFRPKVISLSRPLTELNTETRVTNTILHEVAHALAGPLAGHGNLWKLVARRVGADPVACVAAGDAILPHGTWQGTCPECGHTKHAYRAPRGRSLRLACLKCCRAQANGQWDARFLFQWARNV